MTHEINIYGDIVPFKWFNDGTEYDRADLNNALDSLDLNEGDELIYNLHTFGGCVTTAFAMANKLRRVKNEKKITLTSRADGFGASSSVILLLSADKKIGSKYLKPFVHNAWTWFTMGDKKEAKRVYEELEKVDDEIAEYYSENTSISKEMALQLMSEERDLTLNECLQYGFYTELENVHTVENSMVFNSIISRNSQTRQNLNKNMSKDKSAWNKLKKQVSDFFNDSAQNKIVFTADNSELDFYELGEDDTPAVGDKAKYDGKPAGDSNDGEYTMPSGEIYKFTGEELTEIVPKEDDTEDLVAENEALKTEVENLKTEIKNLKSEKGVINKKLSDAKAIITNFQKLNEEDDENADGDKRDPKPNPDRPSGSRGANALKNLKNKNGSNK